MKQRYVLGVTKEIEADDRQKPQPRKKGFKAVDELLDQQGPMEEQEQEALLHEFEELQLSAARTWRGLFGVGAGLLALLYGWYAWQQALHPWGIRITGELRATGANGDVMAIVLLLQSAAMAACSFALLRERPPKGALARGCLPGSLLQRVLLLGSVGLGLLCACYWANVHHTMVKEFGRKDGSKNELLWVPIAPPLYRYIRVEEGHSCINMLVALMLSCACSALCCWVVSSLRSTGQEVEGLRNLMYMHRSA